MPRFILPLLLAVIGLILFGQGAYIHAKALVAQVLLERAFEKAIATGHETKPWSWADTWPVARIEVKRLHASAIALAGSSGQALAFGPGHVERTPEAGERGVAVYSAHRDTHFAFLRSLRADDEIDVETSRGAARYRVREVSIVDKSETRVLDAADAAQLTLITCYPFNAVMPGTALRYVVVADLVT